MRDYFKLKLPRWPFLILAGAIIPNLLSSLWRIVIEGVDWSTQTWLIACIVVFTWGMMAGIFAWFVIPGRIKMTLDQFMFNLNLRFSTMENSIYGQLGTLQNLVTAKLKEEEESQTDQTEYWLASTAALLVDHLIAEDPVPKGHCKCCHQPIPNWEDTAPGSPERYLKKHHGKMPNGWPCPLPFMHHLVSLQRSQIEIRAKSNVASHRT